MTGLTGAVLVGGASERFGSPKALGRLRDETLAARAGRLLEEACDEVLVVGKAADGLPFPVLDDGAVSRAPVHGVVAALRHARRDVVVALPVDVPLVTPGALRALGVAEAVPSGRIPLPGAYPRSLLPELEQRVAGGQLSLRGVNPTTLELPEGLLVDVDTPEALAQLERPRHAVVVGGTGMLASATRALAERGHPRHVDRASLGRARGRGHTDCARLSRHGRAPGGAGPRGGVARPDRARRLLDPHRRTGGARCDCGRARAGRPARAGLRHARLGARPRARSRRVPTGAAGLTRRAVVDTRGDLGRCARSGRRRPAGKRGRRAGRTGAWLEPGTDVGYGRTGGACVRLESDTRPRTEGALA